MATSTKDILHKIIYLQERCVVSYEVPIRVMVGDKVLELKDDVKLTEVNEGEGFCFILKAEE